MKIMVVQLKEVYSISWIDGYIKDGWTPHFPASTVIHPVSFVAKHYLTLTKKED